MVQINLMTKDMISKKEKKIGNITFKAKILILIGGFIMLTLVATWVCLSTGINKKKAEFSKVEGEWKRVAPMLKKFEELSQEKKQFQDRLTILEEFLSRDLPQSGKNFLWSEKLEQLNNIIPEQIWLTSLSLEEDKKGKKKFLNIDGAVTSLRGESMLTTMSEFVGRIKEDKVFFKDFQELELKNVKKSSIEKIDIMTFELILHLNPIRKDGSNG